MRNVISHISPVCVSRFCLLSGTRNDRLWFIVLSMDDVAGLLPVTPMSLLFSSITLPKLRSRRLHRLLSTILPSSLSHRLLCSSMSWLPFARWVTFLYLFGRYFLGVKPVKPGYEEFEIRPELGGLEFIEGKIPLPKGEISVYRNADLIRIQASSGSGYLYFSSSLPPKASRGEIEKFIGKNQYRLWIDAGDEVGVTFTQSPSSKTT